MPRLLIDGVELAYTEWGEGPAVVMTHGFGMSTALFERTAVSLAEDHRVVAWDLRGHGRSDAPDPPDAYSVDTAVGDVAALLDHLGIEHATLLGHSLGGYLSLEFHRLLPASVAALVLVATGPGYRRDNGRVRWNRMVERIAARLESDGLAGLEIEGVVDPGALHQTADGLAKAARGMLRQDDARVMDHLESIDVPVLIVTGEHDTPYQAAAGCLADRIRRSVHVEIPHAQHVPMLSHPEAFAHAVRSFLDANAC